MNKPAPFSVRQMEYFQRCFSNWFNVAEGGKRGGKNVLQVMAFCTLLETHKNKIHLVAGVSVATAKLNILRLCANESRREGCAGVGRRERWG